MRIRDIRESDIPILQSYADASGFPYPNLNDPLIEAVLVVADSRDVPIMACAAKRLIELCLFVQPGQTPAVKMAAMRILDTAMATTLREKLYNDCEVFIPPQIAVKFGRRIERTFQWVKNWPSWTKRL